MYKGLLRIKGEVELSQFWPQGESDADTVKVHIQPDSFEFSPDPKSEPFEPTDVFASAYIRAKSTKPKPVISKGRITIRLQGIDATELHFAALLPKKGLPGNGTKFRQYFGETATDKLYQHLARGKTRLPCEVLTAIDRPSDACDVYGRFVADVVIELGKSRINLNRWLVEQGWAVPAFYNSMSPQEIERLRKLGDIAQKKNRGLWSKYSRRVGALNEDLTYRRKGPVDPAKDKGPVIMPKLFRRQVRYHIAHKNGAANMAFPEYLAKQKDAWVDVKSFLKKPGMTKPPAAARYGSLGSLFGQHDTFRAMPDELVFFEKPSKLTNIKGQELTKW